MTELAEPWTLDDVAQRAARAARVLTDEARAAAARDDSGEASRLLTKAGGVRLVLSYLEEAITHQIPGRDPNMLARELADARDTIEVLKVAGAEMAEVAAKWRRWAEDIDYVNIGAIKPEALAAYDFETMLTEADRALDKIKDEAYERGEAEGMRTAEALLHDAMRAHADRHGIQLWPL